MVPIRYLIRFIEEDAPRGDITTDVIVPEVPCSAVIRAEQDGIIAGLSEASALFTHFGVTVTGSSSDGDRVKTGDVVLSLHGGAKNVLLVERTALNIIGRMSGIATNTRELADLAAVKNPSCRVAATRKICPGFGALDKKAVSLGGGDPHRATLSDGFLIKDNHLALVPIREAIARAKAYSAYKKIEVEVESAGDALIAAECGADIILLDNMTPNDVTATIKTITEAGLRDRVTIEISGGIDASGIGAYAASGADVISMGALTHTVKNFSVTLELTPE